MTEEEIKIKRREYIRKWYARKKNDPEWVERKNANQRKYLSRNKEKTMAYRKSPRGKMLHAQASLKYYYAHREERRAYSAERRKRLTPEQIAKRNTWQRAYMQRRNAVKRMDKANKELIAKAQSVADELNNLFEQWDR